MKIKWNKYNAEKLAEEVTESMGTNELCAFVYEYLSEGYNTNEMAFHDDLENMVGENPEKEGWEMEEEDAT